MDSISVRILALTLGRRHLVTFWCLHGRNFAINIEGVAQQAGGATWHFGVN